MLKFKVKLQGKYYKIEVEKRSFFFRKRFELKQIGFYATRFVESESADEAIKKVIEMVKSEVEEVAISTKYSELELYEIQQDNEAFDLFAPGQGFTFYVEENG